MRRELRVWTVTLLSLVGAVAVVLADSVDVTSAMDPARSYLTASLNLTDVDFERIDRGQVVAKTLPVNDPLEIETFGVMRLRVTPAFYVERLADIQTFKQDPEVLQIGVFGNPPRLGDTAALTLDDSDIRALRQCRVGDCGVQLSEHAIGRFRNEVEWQRVDAPQRANRLMREILVDYVAAYQQGGEAVSMKYADQAESMSLAQGFGLVGQSDRKVWEPFGSLRQHLAEYPGPGPAGMIDVLYWSKEKVARRTVASITHLAIVPTSADSPADYAIASKQIYGSHYFDASMGLTVLLPDRASTTPVTYVVYVNRSRIDVLDGMLGGMARRLISSRARATVADKLTRLQLTLEQQFSRAPR